MKKKLIERKVEMVSLGTIIGAAKILARKPQKGMKQIKAWAVLEEGQLVQEVDLEREYWIMPKKPRRSDYHKDFTFVECTITYSLPLKPIKK